MVLSACTAVRPARAVPLLECAAALAEPAARQEVAVAMAEAGAPTRAWALLQAADAQPSWPLAFEVVARAAAEAGDVALVEAITRAAAGEWGQRSRETLEVRRAASLGYLRAGRQSRARNEAEAAGARAPWLDGAALLHGRGESRQAKEWLERALGALDEWSALPAAELARKVGATEQARVALRRLALPGRDARVAAAAFLVGDAARAREELGGTLGGLSTAVRALARHGMTAEVDALLAGQLPFERAQALAHLASLGDDARWADSAAAAQQIDEPHTRAWTWVTLARVRRASDPRETEAWMRLAEQEAARLHEDDRDELLVEGWAQAGECARAVEFAAGRPRFLLIAVSLCREPSHLDLLERERDRLDGRARDEVTGRLVETALALGQAARATRLAATLRPPLLVRALVALALEHAEVSPALFPSCGAREP
ncbi:MAG: hypothetical protein JNJ54_08580 [Myxococcaceae bacterium]|nr:hypothetical protein [Myxococcaceae bacterium]